MLRRHKPRHGIVLLVVLTLLTLLVVIALTFAALSGQFRRGAEANARQERYGDAPKPTTDRVIYQLLRDTPANSRSVLNLHSLLRDLVGNDGAKGRVLAILPPLDGEFLQFTIEPPFDTAPSIFDTQTGHYNGCTLTFIDPVFNTSATRSMIADSTRIVNYMPTLNAGGVIQSITIFVEWTAGEGGEKFFPVAGTTRFVINGRPFSGTGAGYLHAAPNYSLDAAIQFLPAHPSGVTPFYETSLLPNYGTYSSFAPIVPNLGGLDESWDTVDYQNMFMSMVPPDATTGIIPSFHRPALVNYWLKRFAAEELHASTTVKQMVEAFRMPGGDDNQIGTTDDPIDGSGSPIDPDILRRLVQLKRMVILRPLPEDHPNFPNGVNFAASMGLPDELAAAQQPVPPSQALPQMIWDVDNDGDGIPDSIWLDVGLPIQTDASGRRYRPLVAILCQDLDGRLNVNAHSSAAQWESIFATGGILQQLPSAADPAQPYAPPAVAGRALVARGLGYGPAEIYLGHIFGTDDFEHILRQRYLGYGAPFLGRVAGIYDFDDPLSQIKCLGIPFDYYNTLGMNPFPVSAFASPPELWGNGGIGLDYTGQPIFIYMGKRKETLDDPYEIVLNRKSAGYVDAPFTYAELERVLRHDDQDAFGLPNRLVHNGITNAPMTAFNNPQVRQLVTTHSSHVPSIAGTLPKKLRQYLQASDMKSQSILDLYRTKLLANGFNAQTAAVEMQKIVPWEILHGERFNVNRLWGNGRDDNANGVVDEPFEADGGELIWPPGLPGGFDGSGSPGYIFNYLNDDPQLTDALNPALTPIVPPLTSRNRFASQIYARQLYCLMMLLADHLNNAEYFHPILEDISALPGTSTFKRRELTAQRIAQWAINVVDFRDSNAIMTPFEYDVFPFNGWQPNIDGDPRTAEGNERRIVWGAEYPDLVMTESIAFHDRRVKDTTIDSTGQKIDASDPASDQTMDQYRIPQGSLFLEFYCTRNRTDKNPAVPFELYNTAGGLDLARLSPGGIPVWRVAISQSHHAGAPTPVESPYTRRTSKPHTTSFQPENMSLLPAPTPDVIDIERLIWFAPVEPTSVGVSAAEAQKIFWNRNAVTNAQVAPSSYLVVGPRPETRVGSQAPAITVTPPVYLPSQQRISLLPGRVEIFNNNGTDRTPPLTLVKQAQTMVAAANPPADPSTSPATPIWTDVSNTAPMGIGLNVTEPLPLTNYYPEPTASLSTADSDPLRQFPFDSYYDYDALAGVLPDQPFDSQAGMPLDDDALLATESTDDYKTAFLQRLANPLEPWDPVGNPYITVDWIPIDVTVFNGEDPPGAPDPDDPNNSPSPDFETRERGGANLNLWSLDTQAPSASSAAGTTDYFDFNLVQSLGYLNEAYGTAGVNHPVGATLAQAPAPAPLISAPSPDYVGDPAAGPFPWLVWNNRPFANPMELMQVPASSPGRLLHEFNIYQTGSPQDDPYDTETYSTTVPSSVNDVGQFVGTFPHLLNFFHSSKNDQANQNDRGANFYRLFDYVETPSPFVGAEKWYNPISLATANNEFHYHPPFNHLSRFQDPGRININTIFDLRVWVGIAKAFPGMDPTGLGAEMFRRLMESRRGYASAAGVFELNSDYPTLIGNPFRSADSADLMPDVGPTPPPSPAYQYPSLRKQEPVQATLLREDMLTPAGANNRTQSVNVVDPTAVPTALDLYQNQDRNSYFRYQGLARLSNLVSNNSNVYAVWMTLGYFEVESNPGGVDRAHPDGFRLGAELGTELGTVKRHRAFYIIDRSIPVAFEPGQNHNVDKCIQLRRFIE